MTNHMSIHSKKLEDAFFAENDLKLIAQLQTLRQLEESIESLSKVSGITSKSVLKKLVELDIRPESVAALAMVPVIEIAWADGKLDDKERSAVLAYAEKHFASKNEIARDLLSEWLKCKPSKEMLEAWIHYVQGLCENLNPQEKTAFKDSLMNNAHDVAKVSGGFLGMGNKISKEEQKILKILDGAFE